MRIIRIERNRMPRSISARSRASLAAAARPREAGHGRARARLTGERRDSGGILQCYPFVTNSYGLRIGLLERRIRTITAARAAPAASRQPSAIAPKTVMAR